MDARQRLLDQLVGTEAEEGEHGIVGLQDLSLEIGDEHRVGGVLDQALRVGTSLVQLPHVTQDSDRADYSAIGVAQRRGIESRRDDLAARATRVEPGVARDTPRHDLPQRRGELPSLLRADEA